MVGQGRVVGVILTIIGLIIGLAITLWLLSGMAEGTLRYSGFALGLVIALILAIPFFATGVYLIVKGRKEVKAFAELERERRVLDMVQAHGQVRVAEVALELDATRDQVKDYVYDLVGKGLFTGYINWDEGVFYAKQASELKTNKCPHCGGELELVGKGVVRCPYCGTEIFL